MDHTQLIFQDLLLFCTKKVEKITIIFFTFVTGVKHTSWCLLRPWYKLVFLTLSKLTQAMYTQNTSFGRNHWNLWSFFFLIPFGRRCEMKATQKFFCLLSFATFGLFDTENRVNIFKRLFLLNRLMRKLVNISVFILGRFVKQITRLCP